MSKPTLLEQAQSLAAGRSKQAAALGVTSLAGATADAAIVLTTSSASVEELGTTGYYTGTQAGVIASGGGPLAVSNNGTESVTLSGSIGSGDPNAGGNTNIEGGLGFPGADGIEQVTFTLTNQGTIDLSVGQQLQIDYDLDTFIDSSSGGTFGLDLSINVLVEDGGGNTIIDFDQALSEFLLEDGSGNPVDPVNQQDAGTVLISGGVADFGPGSDFNAAGSGLSEVAAVGGNDLTITSTVTGSISALNVNNGLGGYSVGTTAQSIGVNSLTITTVPEPSSAVLAGFGGVAALLIGFSRRWRRSAAKAGRAAARHAHMLLF